MTLKTNCYFALFLILSALTINGCGGNTEQRQSGTLATPIDAVEQAGEAQGKAEDAKKANPKGAAAK